VSLISFRGQVSRTELWVTFFGLFVARSLLVVAINVATGHLSGGGNASEIIGLLFLWPQAAVLAKRGHARRRSTTYTLSLFSVAVAGLSLVVFGRIWQQFGVSVIGATIWLGVVLYFAVEYGLRDGASPGRNDALPAGKVSA
jgi:uncharacterized membrane protein YhaH (DUF805 family)